MPVGIVARHWRFFVAIAAGLLAFAFQPLSDLFATRLLAAGTGFFATYLILTIPYLATSTPAVLRERVAAGDEGLPVLLLLTVGTIALSLFAILLLLGRNASSDLAGTVLAIAAVPLGWLTLHTVAAFHYAGVYYAPAPNGGDTGGLDFPGTEVPEPWDFVYFAFVIGMTAQVADVSIRSRRMRRLALLHGVSSFFYNTVILALVVNAVLALGG